MKIQRMLVDDDESYSPGIKEPAYEKDGPVVLVDAGHRNFAWQHGIFRLLTADGYQAKGLNGQFTFDALQQATVLVVAGPGVMRSRKDLESPQPLFTEVEAATLHDWVPGGGRLVLAGSKEEIAVLLRRFDVEFSRGVVSDEKLVSPKSAQEDRDYKLDAGNGGLSQDGIINGRRPEEQVKAVLLDSIATAIVKTPANARPLLRCSGNAMTYEPDSLQVRELKAVVAASVTAGKIPPDAASSPAPAQRKTPVPHVPLAIAFAFGKGRVVVVPNSMMFTAMIRREVINGKKAETGRQIGLTEADNQQFALNIMHWLSGLID